MKNRTTILMLGAAQFMFVGLWCARGLPAEPLPAADGVAAEDGAGSDAGADDAELILAGAAPASSPFQQGETHGS